MAPFFAMVISFVAKQKKDWPRREVKRSYFTSWRESNSAHRKFTGQLIRSVPVPVRLICIAVFIYVAINFALFLMNLEGGGPQAQNGRYYLKSHGLIIRELTEEEFHRFRAYELRGFAGHWILFSLIPTVYFAWGHRVESVSKTDRHEGEC